MSFDLIASIQSLSVDESRINQIIKEKNVKDAENLLDSNKVAQVNLISSLIQVVITQKPSQAKKYIEHYQDVINGSSSKGQLSVAAQSILISSLQKASVISSTFFEHTGNIEKILDLFPIPDCNPTEEVKDHVSQFLVFLFNLHKSAKLFNNLISNFQQLDAQRYQEDCFANKIGQLTNLYQEFSPIVPPKLLARFPNLDTENNIQFFISTINPHMNEMCNKINDLILLLLRNIPSWIHVQGENGLGKLIITAIDEGNIQAVEILMKHPLINHIDPISPENTTDTYGFVTIIKHLLQSPQQRNKNSIQLVKIIVSQMNEKNQTDLLCSYPEIFVDAVKLSISLFQHLIDVFKLDALLVKQLHTNVFQTRVIKGEIKEKTPFLQGSNIKIGLSKNHLNKLQFHLNKAFRGLLCLLSVQNYVKFQMENITYKLKKNMNKLEKIAAEPAVDELSAADKLQRFQKIKAKVELFKEKIKKEDALSFNMTNMRKTLEQKIGEIFGEVEDEDDTWLLNLTYSVFLETGAVGGVKIDSYLIPSDLSSFQL